MLFGLRRVDKTRPDLIVPVHIAMIWVARAIFNYWLEDARSILRTKMIYPVLRRFSKRREAAD